MTKQWWKAAESGLNDSFDMMIPAALLAWQVFDLDKLAGHFRVPLCRDKCLAKVEALFCMSPHLTCRVLTGTYCIIRTCHKFCRLVAHTEVYITVQCNAGKDSTALLSFLFVPPKSTTHPTSPTSDSPQTAPSSRVSDWYSRSKRHVPFP